MAEVKMDIDIKELLRKKFGTPKDAFICGLCGTTIEDDLISCAVHDADIGRVCNKCYRGLDFQTRLLEKLSTGERKNPRNLFTSDSEEFIMVI
jgi:ribosome-binding protein aMBF1 (putative translation factor)